MTNLHLPERQPGESFDQYKARRAASKAALRAMTKGPTQPAAILVPGMPPPNWVHWWTGQHTNPAKNGRRAEFAKLGRRQSLKRIKYLRREVKARMTAAGML